MHLDDSALLQCRIGLISEVIVISIVIDIVNPIETVLMMSQPYRHTLVTPLKWQMVKSCVAFERSGL